MTTDTAARDTPGHNDVPDNEDLVTGRHREAVR